MEAAHRWSFSSLAVLISILSQYGVDRASAQNARSQNFLVLAPDQALAEAEAPSAEKFRDELTIDRL